MKRSLSIFIVLIVTALLGGCILSKAPNTNDVSMDVGDHMTFSVSEFPPPATYTWTLDGSVVSTSGNSYVYIGLAGQHTLTVTETDSLPIGNHTASWNITTNPNRVDQSNLLNSGWYWTAMSWNISQTFEPSMPFLTGVDIDLTTANARFGDTTIMVEILNDNNQVLATASQLVRVGSSDPGLVHFDFAQDIEVVVGATYTVYVPGTTDTFGWKYSSGNLYPKGFRTLGTTPHTDEDCLFQTYGHN
jgi:hypothetical protein